VSDTGGTPQWSTQTLETSCAQPQATLENQCCPGQPCAFQNRAIISHLLSTSAEPAQGDLHTKGERQKSEMVRMQASQVEVKPNQAAGDGQTAVAHHIMHVPMRIHKVARHAVLRHGHSV
jgi:hypothetical protein